MGSTKGCKSLGHGSRSRERSGQRAGWLVFLPCLRELTFPPNDSGRILYDYLSDLVAALADYELLPTRFDHESVGLEPLS